MSLDLTQPADTPASPGLDARVLVVVLTSGRRPDLLDRTITSALDQRNEPADVVLVAPVGAVDARELAARRAITVVTDPGRGAAAAINAGLAAGTSHRYVTWLTEDDALLPGAVAVAAAALDADARAVAAYGDCRQLSAGGDYLYTPHAGPYAGAALPWGPGRLTQPAMLLRLDAVAAVGGLDETLAYAMDLDLLLKLRREGRFVTTGRTLASFLRDDRAATAAHRERTAAEEALVRHRYLPPQARRLAPLWEATARLLDRRAHTRAQRAAHREPAAPSN